MRDRKKLPILPYTNDPHPASRWRTFLKSGECLTCSVLLGCLGVLLREGNSITSIPAFAILRSVSEDRGGEALWGTIFAVLVALQLGAVGFADATVRGVTMLGQAALFGFFAYALHKGSPLGFLWATFAACGLWLLVRSLALLVRAVRE